MKKLLFFLITLVLSLSNSFSQVFQNADVKVSLIGDKIWVIETSDNTTMYLVEGSKKALLIDTGTKCDSLDKVVQHLTSKPYDVVLTHGHSDHSGNIRYFKTIYMHVADTFFLTNSHYHGKINFVKDGDVFDLGDKKIEVRHMPAHTPGSIILVDWKAKCCFTGDAFGSGQVWLQLRPYANMQTYINSCTLMEGIMDKGIDKVYCGHYFYSQGVLYKDYIVKMKELAISLKNGKALGAKPYPTKVSIGCDNPMIVENGNAAIVYDPEHVN